MERSIRGPVTKVSEVPDGRYHKDSPDFVQKLDAVETSLIRDLLVRLARRPSVADVVSASTTENDDVQQ